MGGGSGIPGMPGMGGRGGGNADEEIDINVQSLREGHLRERSLCPFSRSRQLGSRSVHVFHGHGWWWRHDGCHDGAMAAAAAAAVAAQSQNRKVSL